MSENQIEELVDKRFEDKIKPEIKNQVIAVINKKIWLIASICIAIFTAVVMNIFNNNSRLVRIETKQEDFIQYNKEANAQLRETIKEMQQRHDEDVEEINNEVVNNKESLDNKLNTISHNQSIIIYGLKHVDQSFNLDILIRDSDNLNGNFSN